MFLPCLCGFTVLAFLVVTIWFYVGMVGKHKERLDQEIKRIMANVIPAEIKEASITLYNRKFDYIRNYQIFQLASKISGLASVVFAILGMISQFAEVASVWDMNIWLPIAISFFSIVFVILALYLSPVKRIQQYIAAWKKCDQKVNYIQSKLSYYEYLNHQYQQAKARDYDKTEIEYVLELIKVECSIILSPVDESESFLTSDEE